MERSYLFVPGHRTDLIKKALSTETDAVIVDLEDAVANERKEEIRYQVFDALRDIGRNLKKIYLRINETKSPFYRGDVELALQLPITGVVLPKAQSREELLQLDKLLLEKSKIIPLIESAKGVFFCKDIASASRNVERIAFGAVDYCLDMGISITDQQEELIFPRSLIAVASRTSGIEPPIDTVYVNFKDLEGLKEEAKRAKRLGFLAKLCIHPEQVNIVNQIFSPTMEEQNWAKEIIKAFEKAELQGVATIQVDGTMVDYPVYKQALQIMKRSSLV